MVKITSHDTLLAAKAGQSYKKELPFSIAGKEFVAESEVVNGEMETIEFTKPLGEMLTSPQGAEDLLRKVVLDVDLGREQVPLLYKSIYRTIEDSTLPKLIDATFAQRGNVIFTEWQEGEEIKFGALSAEKGPATRLTAFAAGFEYTEDMVLYNEQFGMQVLNEAFGEAYNALLNDLHLGPIIKYNEYPTANQTAAITTFTGDFALERNTIATLNAALTASRKDHRAGTILLASSEDQVQIEAAFANYTVGATPFPGVTGINEVIFYDGWETTVGKKQYTYEGVPKGTAFLIRPKRGLIEFVKHGLRIDSALADLSRLIEAQVVARTRRGAYIAIDDNVQKITLPTA